jgi:hypothetical protein
MEATKITPTFLVRLNPIFKTTIVIVIPFILEFKNYIPMFSTLFLASVPLFLLILELVHEFGTTNVMYIDKEFNRCGYVSICKYKKFLYRYFCSIVYFIGIIDKNYTMSLESIIGIKFELKLLNTPPAPTYCHCLVPLEDKLSIYIVENLQIQNV